MTRIKLKAPHTHAGRKYPPGAELAMPAPQADWLISIGVAMPAPPPAASDEAPAKTPKAKE